MTALDDAARRQRAASLRVEREYQQALTDAYRAIVTRLQADLDALAARVQDAQDRGEDVGQSWLDREYRYRALIAQAEAEFERYGRQASYAIANGQRAAATAALTTSEAVLRAALGTPPPGVVASFNRLPVVAIEELVGNLGDGRPLAALLDGLGAEASAAGRRALVEALGRGLSPRQAAREFRRATGVAATRALTINRQEINRAYRDATLATYRENGDVVRGWRWLCANGKRTCAMCYAMSGKVFPLDRPFASHVACRCTVLPVTRPVERYRSLPPPDDGPTAFGRLTEAEQRAILGRGKYDLYAAGDLDWDDLITVTRSPVWGLGRRETPLRDLPARQAEAAD